MTILGSTVLFSRNLCSVIHDDNKPGKKEKDILPDSTWLKLVLYTHTYRTSPAEPNINPNLNMLCLETDCWYIDCVIASHFCWRRHDVSIWKINHKKERSTSNFKENTSNSIQKKAKQQLREEKKANSRSISQSQRRYQLTANHDFSPLIVLLIKIKGFYF